MKSRHRISLRTKIISLAILLIVGVVIAFSIQLIHLKLKDDMNQAKQLALQSAKTLSYMPILQESYREDGNRSRIVSLAEDMMYKVRPMTVFFLNREGVIYASTDENEIYTNLDIKDIDQALTYGSSYVHQAEENGRQVLKAVAPVSVDYNDYKKIEGIVIVLYELELIYNEVREDFKTILLRSSAILLIAVIGSYYLANSIRKDTLNLEPYEIATLYRERNAVLQSVKEGIIAVDGNGIITMMNVSACQMLGVEKQVEGRKLSDVIESPELLRIIDSNNRQNNVEIQHRDKIIIINTQPIIENHKKIGVVGTVRDRTELKQMIGALSEVKQYSDDLRAQAHEFSNKLYTILGLLQLGKQEDAINFIKVETQAQIMEQELLFIKDEKVQAILLGKSAQASEKKVQFILDPECSLEKVPENISMSSLIIILGNLINNGFDAVENQEEKLVRFFVTDIGNEIIFEVMDNGDGIPDEVQDSIFAKGFSTKGNNRGYGLAHVNEEVEGLGGIMEFTSEKGRGTVFTIYLPK
ncbi:ATP-binding protein [Pradoshia sp.]